MQCLQTVRVRQSPAVYATSGIARNIWYNKGLTVKQTSRSLRCFVHMTWALLAVHAAKAAVVLQDVTVHTTRL